MDTATPDTGNDVDPGLLTALEAEDLIGNLETFLMQLGFRSVQVKLKSIIDCDCVGWLVSEECLRTVTLFVVQVQTCFSNLSGGR